jgi:hypothetical protein
MLSLHSHATPGAIHPSPTQELEACLYVLMEMKLLSVMRGDVDGAKDERHHPFYAQIPGCTWNAGELAGYSK